MTQASNMDRFGYSVWDDLRKVRIGAKSPFGNVMACGV